MTEHAKIRLLQRYGVKPTKIIQNYLINCIQDGKTFVIMRLSRTRTIHAIRYGEKLIFALYVNSNSTCDESHISTFLTSGMVLNHTGWDNRQLNDVKNYLYR